LGKDVRRKGDRHSGRHLRDDPAERPFVRGVLVTVQQTDGDRIDAERDESLDGSPGSGFVERLDDVPVAIQSLVDLEAPAPLDKRSWLRPGQIVHPRVPKSTDLEGVAEPSGRKEARPRTLSLENRVRRDC